MTEGIAPQAASVRLQPMHFVSATPDAAPVRVAAVTPTAVPLARAEVAVNIGVAKYFDPTLAKAISEVRLPAAGVTRDNITVPISPAEEASDLVLFEDSQDEAKKYYIPRYRLGSQQVSGSKQYRASLEENENGWRFTLHLEKYPAAEIELASRAASELAHEVVVVLQYRLPGSGGMQKELVFQEVTAESGAIAATLLVNSLGERDELVRAISLADYSASLIVRRAIKVAVPAPRATGGDGATKVEANKLRERLLVRHQRIRPNLRRVRSTGPRQKFAVVGIPRPVAEGTPQPTAAEQPEVVSSGTGTLPVNSAFSFDTGREGGEGDVSWQQPSGTQRLLAPQGEAQIAELGAVNFDAVTFEQLKGLSYGAGPLDGSAGGFGPEAVLLVTQDWSPRGKAGVYNNHSIGVWFERGSNRWAIFNEDVQAMPVGASFHVMFLPPGTNAFVHRAAAANINGHMTYLDHPALNNNPNAILTVTQDWEPGGGGGVYNRHHIGVWYERGKNKWAIFNEDVQPMPVGAGFHVEVRADGPDAFIHRAQSAQGNINGHATFLNHPALNRNPNALLSVTQDWEPRGQGGVYNDHSIGVWHAGERGWGIFNQDIKPMPEGAAFHVVVRQESESSLVHVASPSNINGHMTYVEREGRQGGKLALGNVFAVLTNDGNYAKVQVTGYGLNLGLRWVTYDGGEGEDELIEEVWVEDALPAGAVAAGDEPWNWVRANPEPLSGGVAHQSGMSPATHQHYFERASATLTPAPGESLFAYVYLDPANPPRQVMLQWNDGNWEHRAYWGENLIGWGSDGTASRKRMGELPPAGRWVRLEVPASVVGLEGRPINGMAFTLHGGRATWDRAGKCGPDTTGGEGEDDKPSEEVWVEDALPVGAVAAGDEPWNWVRANPEPFSGSAAHQSSLNTEFHQHFFTQASPPLTPAPGESLFAYVYLDPANPPRQVMLQWNDGNWEHRAYWGENLIGAGTDGTASCRRRGGLPPAGRWVRLEVPASVVGLEGRPINGMAFTLHGGRATWDRAGKCKPNTKGPLFREATRTLDDVQQPFMFDRDLHGYIFHGVKVAASQGAGFIARQFKWKDSWGAYYQSQATPYLFYFLPDAMKIARRPQTPHAPIMSVQFESSDGSQEKMQVTLDYAAAPYVDTERIEAAAAEFRRFLPTNLPPGISDPVFEPLLVDSKSLTFSLSLPRADVSKGPFQPREGALVDIRTGLADSLKLPLADFQLIFDAMADMTGAATLLKGWIEVNLGAVAGKINPIPFNARMNDLVGDLFDYAEEPDAATGGVKSTLRNAIESPLVIKRLAATLRRGGAEVDAEIRGLTTPAELTPGQEVQFTVVPTSALPGTGAPRAVFDLAGVEVRPDRDAIWTVIAAGQRPEYSKEVTVKTNAATFAAPAGGPGDQIIELVVELRSGGTVALTPEKLIETTKVRFPIGDVIVGKPSTGEYSYQVTAVRNSGVSEGQWKTTSRPLLWVLGGDVPPPAKAG